MYPLAEVAESCRLERGEYQMVERAVHNNQEESTRSSRRAAVMVLVALGITGAMLVATKLLLAFQNDMGAFGNYTESFSVAAPLRNTLAPLDLEPAEHRHDGNMCEDGEELFAGLCYKTCATLTHGEAPVRTSPFSCCSGYPCNNKNIVTEITLPCLRFDVNGRNGCPHPPGACLTDEELFVGLCYKKCSLLTDGRYVNRVAAATCCKQQGLDCINLFEDWTDGAFNVGGGEDGDGTSMLERVHLPLPALTEELIGNTTPWTLSVSDATVVPLEDRHDGNVCGDDEELHAQLCYKKCSLLTEGEYPVRGSAFSCCQSYPCDFLNQKLGGATPCHGFDVSAFGGCPHSPGVCLVDEELYLGLCYKKCSVLNPDFPNRVSPMTCCKRSGWECFVPGDDASRTKLSYMSSGGDGVGNSTAPRVVHAPWPSLTEAL